MTFIEFFDETAANNIGACLTYGPERVIYIGDNAKRMRKHIVSYEKLFAARGLNIAFLYKTVSKSNLENAVSLLSEIVETYDDCIFDITGGQEILLVALGIVYAKYPHKNIQIHKFNIRNNTVCDCDKDGTPTCKELPVLSVDENIMLYGGKVVYGDVQGGLTYRWELTEDFLRDVDMIWNVCKGNVRNWNMQIGIFGDIEAVGRVEEDGLTTVVSRAALEQYLVRHKGRYDISEEIISRLLKYGLLTFFFDGETEITISYKNKQVKKCLTKAGQALEMKIYTAAQGALDTEGIPVYNDACNGVVIDWDGAFGEEDDEGKCDTRNEIDVLLMHGIVPVFISCKNGFVTADELYKLSAVAERFGGPYAKKVLVATAISDFGGQGDYLRQRAADMNIKVLEDIQKMTDEELKRKLRNLWNN